MLDSPSPSPSVRMRVPCPRTNGSNRFTGDRCGPQLGAYGEFGGRCACPGGVEGGAAVMAARSAGSRAVSPAWLRASSSPSKTRCMCSTASRTSPAIARSSSRSGCPSKVTSIAVRAVAGGVRSSWAALAMNSGWPSHEARQDDGRGPGSAKCVAGAERSGTGARHSRPAPARRRSAGDRGGGEGGRRGRGRRRGDVDGKRWDNGTAGSRLLDGKGGRIPASSRYRRVPDQAPSATPSPRPRKPVLCPTQ